MANFDEFKQKAKDTMESIADRSVELYKIAEEKTKLFAKITKLSTEIALEKGTVRKLHREIGKKYYELHKSAPEEALAQSCAEVTAALDCISAKQKEIEELKSFYDIGDKDYVASDADDQDVEVEIIIEGLDDDAADESESLDDNSAQAEGIKQEPTEFKM